MEYIIGYTPKQKALQWQMHILFKTKPWNAEIKVNFFLTNFFFFLRKPAHIPVSSGYIFFNTLLFACCSVFHLLFQGGCGPFLAPGGTTHEFKSQC